MCIPKYLLSISVYPHTAHTPNWILAHQSFLKSPLQSLSWIFLCKHFFQQTSLLIYFSGVATHRGLLIWKILYGTNRNSLGYWCLKWSLYMFLSISRFFFFFLGWGKMVLGGKMGGREIYLSLLAFSSLRIPTHTKSESKILLLSPQILTDLCHALC